MVEPIGENEDSRMSGNDSDGWSEEDNQDGDDLSHPILGDDIEVVANVGPGYKSVPSELVRVQVVKRIEELQELYSLEMDSLIIIARNYKWNPD